ncbi:arsenate reductase ArsC [uncultured Methanoregula sp.]|uniref:arsenate reductase ArsC n=1 Tax=uncultured Methanoregula sp. TaxID=1005933 RepID=UPI002AAB62CA|nr:arsenate reductase ArsC [uncultured Methanoregula sp.]
MTKKVRVLFVCTANAARSQMAEGLLRAKYGDRYEAFSAGTRQSTLSPDAVAAMREIGIDISHHRSKTLDEVAGQPIDIAVTVCDRAHQVCPLIPFAKKTIHCGFMDPHTVKGAPGDIAGAYRSVRDAMAAWIDREFGGYLPA